MDKAKLRTISPGLPAGWRRRLVRFKTPGTNGVVAWCLEPHDLWIAKAIAGRPKDLEFCQAVARAKLVTKRELRERLRKVRALDKRIRSLVEGRIDRFTKTDDDVE